MRPLPSQDYLKECFDYQPETGVLTWLVRPPTHFSSARGWNRTNSQFAGKEAGHVLAGRDKRIVVIINGVCYQAARVIWKLVRGEESPLQLDHEDADATNNRWRNLRLATHKENCRNRRLRSDNALGLKGVSYHFPGARNPFQAYIGIGGKQIHLGLFPTAEAAKDARDVVAKTMHGQFFRS